MKTKATFIAISILLAVVCLWLGWRLGHAHAQVRYVMKVGNNALPAGVAQEQAGSSATGTNEGTWRPEEFISDLDESVHFTDQNILSWNFPKDWTYKDEIRSKGYLTFTPVKRTVPHIHGERI